MFQIVWGLRDARAIEIASIRDAFLTHLGVITGLRTVALLIAIALWFTTGLGLIAFVAPSPAWADDLPNDTAGCPELLMEIPEMPDYRDAVFELLIAKRTIEQLRNDSANSPITILAATQELETRERELKEKLGADEFSSLVARLEPEAEAHLANKTQQALHAERSAKAQELSLLGWELDELQFDTHFHSHEWTPDSKHIVSLVEYEGTDEQKLVLHDIESKTILAERIFPHNSKFSVDNFSVSPDGKYILLERHPHAHAPPKIIDTFTLQDVFSLRQTFEKGESVEYNWCGRTNSLLARDLYAGRVQILNPEKTKKSAVMNLPAIVKLALCSHDGQHIYAISANQLFIWDTSSPTNSASVIEIPESVTQTALSPDGNSLLLADSEGIVVNVDLVKRKIRYQKKWGRNFRHHNIAWLDDSRFLYSYLRNFPKGGSGSSYFLEIRDGKTGSPLSEIAGRPRQIISNVPAFDFPNYFAITLSSKDAIEFRMFHTGDLKSPTTVGRLKSTTEMSVHSSTPQLLPSPDGNILAIDPLHNEKDSRLLIFKKRTPPEKSP